MTICVDFDVTQIAFVFALEKDGPLLLDLPLSR